MHNFSILILFLDSYRNWILIILHFFFLFYVFLNNFLASEILLINGGHVCLLLCNGFDRKSEAWPLIKLGSDRYSTAKSLNDSLADAQAQTDAASVDALGGAQFSE